MQLQDYTRWKRVASELPRWDARNAMLARLVPTGSSVIDLGAGARTLATYLSDACKYQPVDLIPGPGVIRCDFNAGEFPEVDHVYDVAVVSGVLEYLFDPRVFLAKLSGIARSAIMTYAVRTTGDSLALRSSRGWVNHLYGHQFAAMLEASDRPWTVLGEWRAQMIFGVYFDPAAPLLGGGEVIATDDVEWESRLAALTEHASRTGSVDAQHADADVGRGLAEWADEQRKAWVARLLEHGRARRLQRLPGWSWTSDDHEWTVTLDRLIAVSPGTLAPEEVRAWATAQREARAENTLDVSRVARLDAVSGWTWNAADAQWTDRVTALASFLARERHSVVPPAHVEDGVELGEWTAAQRSSHAVGQLEPERDAAISALPGWIWDQGEARWQRGFSALAAFVDREGHAIVPHGWREHGIDLSAWLDGQERARRKGHLTVERGELLSARRALLGDDEDARAWEVAFAELAAFTARTGHAHPECGDIEEWVVHQRAMQRAGRLVPNLARRLDGLTGWSWSADDADWQRNLAALRQYTEREDHASPVARITEDGVSLGTWVVQQRALHKRGELSPDRTTQLENLSGWSWTAGQGTWERRFVALARYAHERGHALPGSDAPTLHRFVEEQRTAVAEKALGPVEAMRLEGLPGWTWARPSKSFARGFRGLCSYVLREGRADVPSDHVEDGVRLGDWLKRVAAARDAGTLGRDELRLLESRVPRARHSTQTGWNTDYSRLLDRVRVESASTGTTATVRR